MKVVYIASPYTKGYIPLNVHTQVVASHRLLDMKLCPVAPLLSHYLELYKPRPYKEWLDMCLAIIPKVDIVLRLPGESPGAEEEVKLAKSLGIPVCFGWDELDEFLNRRFYDDGVCYEDQ